MYLGRWDIPRDDDFLTRRMGWNGPAGWLKRSEGDNLCTRVTQVSRYFGSCRKILGLTTRVENVYPLPLSLFVAGN